MNNQPKIVLSTNTNNVVDAYALKGAVRDALLLDDKVAAKKDFDGSGIPVEIDNSRKAKKDLPDKSVQISIYGIEDIEVAGNIQQRFTSIFSTLQKEAGYTDKLQVCFVLTGLTQVDPARAHLQQVA